MSCPPARRRRSEASRRGSRSSTWRGAACPLPRRTTATPTKETDALEPADTAVECGSGNVFARLGIPDAGAHHAKTELISRIDNIVRDRGLTQTEAARLMGLSQPDVSQLLRGDFPEYSLKRLFRLLIALGRDIGSSSAIPVSPKAEGCRLPLPRPADRLGFSVGATSSECARLPPDMASAALWLIGELYVIEEWSRRRTAPDRPEA